MNLRKLAYGEPCDVRLPVCNNDPATTVLAHVRIIGVSGMGIKAPDFLGAHACAACHDVYDRRVPTELEREFVELAFLRGMVRTQAKLIRTGKVSL